MNYLAHAYLSGYENDMRLGGFIADAVKGKMINNYSMEIKNGIMLHRSIDAFTDSHAIVKEAIGILKPKYGRYAGVIIDMFFDHFLSKYWNDFSKESLNDFSSNFYILMLKNYLILPAKSKVLLHYMVYNNWFVSYGDMTLFKERLSGMSRRTQFYSGMEKSVIDLKNDCEIFKKYFFDFFSQLISYSEKEKKILSK